MLPRVRIVSVNVGMPRTIEWRDEEITTSIWKSPVEGRVRAAGVNLEGDRQSDLSVHGGVEKAVYVYPSEHYDFWRREIPDVPLPWGAFGENLTTEGLLESDVAIGDALSIGSAEFAVTKPRLPCFKLGIRFGRADMVRIFAMSGRCGFYVSIRREGEVGRGDVITRAFGSPRGLSIADDFGRRLRRADTDA